MPFCTARMWRTASTMLPVPASPLVRIIAAPSPMRRSASPRSRQPHTNGTSNCVLVDVVLLVGRGQHLGLVDVVDLERLEDLRLGEVADPALGHDRDAHRGLDLVDQLRVAHARHAAVLADVRRHALERHHRDRARLLGDLGLVGGDDVHDHAAGEHAGQADLGGPGGSFDGGHLSGRPSRGALYRAARILLGTASILVQRPGRALLQARCPLESGPGGAVVINAPVLVLNQNYEPLNVCDIRRAFRLLGAEKAELLERNHQVIHTPDAGDRGAIGHSPASTTSSGRALA